MYVLVGRTNASHKSREPDVNHILPAMDWRAQRLNLRLGVLMKLTQEDGPGQNWRERTRIALTPL